MKAKQLIEVLQIFQRNAIDGLIGERELRKVLYQYLANPHDHYITTIIANLKYSKAPD